MTEKQKRIAQNEKLIEEGKKKLEKEFCFGSFSENYYKSVQNGLNTFLRMLTAQTRLKLLSEDDILWVQETIVIPYIYLHLYE